MCFLLIPFCHILLILKNFCSLRIQCEPDEINRVNTKTMKKVTSQGHIKYVCPICNQEMTYSGLRRHLQYIHSNKRDFSCSECSFTSGTIQTLKFHIIARNTKKYPHVCDICGAGFIVGKRLEVHKKTKHEGFRWTCKICDKTFLQQHGLKAHQTFIHSDNDANTNVKTKVEGHTCTVCSKVFVSKTNLKIHMDKHSGAHSGFVCEICGAVLSSKQVLIWHQLTHTGEKNYVCDVCGNKYTKKNYLDQHLLVHTKEKPHECEFCKKRFTQRSSLVIHKYQHTQKPYMCESCGKTFTRRNLFQKHHCSAM